MSLRLKRVLPELKVMWNLADGQEAWRAVNENYGKDSKTSSRRSLNSVCGKGSWLFPGHKRENIKVDRGRRQRQKTQSKMPETRKWTTKDMKN